MTWDVALGLALLLALAVLMLELLPEGSGTELVFCCLLQPVKTRRAKVTRVRGRCAVRMGVLLDRFVTITRMCLFIVAEIFHSKGLNRVATVNY